MDVEEAENIEIPEKNYYSKINLLRRSIFVLIAIDITFLISRFSKHTDFNPALPGEMFNIKSIEDFQMLLRDNFIFSLFIFSMIIITGFMIFGIYMEVSKKILSKQSAKKIKNSFELISIIPYFVLIISIVNTSLFSLSVIEGKSMEPNFFENENTIIYHLGVEYERFDVVIIKVPDEGYWIKRIIGLPGEVVVIDHNSIYIDTNKIDQEFLLNENGSIINYTSCFEGNPDYCTFTVPENSYFVLGDNRPVSNDSRGNDLGIVDESQLYGKVIYKYEGLIFNIFD